MARDNRISWAALPEEIITEHYLQIAECLFCLLPLQAAKAVHAFEAFNVVFPP
jgi:hypothetical protein